MGFKHKGQAHIKPPNTKHRIKYWVNEDTTTVVYVWYNAMQGEARIVEWDYSSRLSDADGALNKLRDVLGGKKKISSWAGMSVGKTIERYENVDLPRGTKPFDHAIEKAHEKYDLPD